MKILSNFKINDKVRIKCINCGINFKRRLVELGLFDGSEIRILKNDSYSPLILEIFDSKVALDRVEAEKIYAEKI